MVEIDSDILKGIASLLKMNNIPPRGSLIGGIKNITVISNSIARIFVG
jgi:hypothetical protein